MGLSTGSTSAGVRALKARTGSTTPFGARSPNRIWPFAQSQAEGL